MEVRGVGTDEKRDQAEEGVKDSPLDGEKSVGTEAADESLQATLASPTMPSIPQSSVPAKELDQTIAPGKEVPAATPPAARVPGAGGAAKSTTTPTAATTKGIPKPMAAKATGAVVESTPDPPVNKLRRRIIWASIAGFLITSFLML